MGIQCDYERDCLKAPIPEKCFYFCINSILKRITPQQKQDILGIGQELAGKLFRIYNSRNISSFSNLKAHLTPTEIASLIDIFQNITQDQLDRL